MIIPLEFRDWSPDHWKIPVESRSFYMFHTVNYDDYNGTYNSFESKYDSHIGTDSNTITRTISYDTITFNSNHQIIEPFTYHHNSNIPTYFPYPYHQNRYSIICHRIPRLVVNLRYLPKNLIFRWWIYMNLHQFS